MAKKFKLEIVTPEKVFLSEEVESLIVPAYHGYLGVMADHAPLLCLLKAGEITVKNEGERFFAISSGFMEVAANRVIVLADAVEAVQEIDAARAQRAADRARESLAGKLKDHERQAVQQELERALNRVRLARKHGRGS